MRKIWFCRRRTHVFDRAGWVIGYSGFQTEYDVRRRIFCEARKFALATKSHHTRLAVFPSNFLSRLLEFELQAPRHPGCSSIRMTLPETIFKKTDLLATHGAEISEGSTRLFQSRIALEHPKVVVKRPRRCSLG